MDKRLKELSEYYALKCISLEQLLELAPIDVDLPSVLNYAELYGRRYDDWCKQQSERQQQMEEDWRWFQQTYMEDADTILGLFEDPDDVVWDIEEAFVSVEKPVYSDADLQAAYDIWYYDRKDQIKGIAREAKLQKVSKELIYKFFKDYGLTNAEMTVFWLAYKIWV